MRSQVPTLGVGKLASIPRLSIDVNMPNTIKSKTIAAEKILKPFPNTDAPKPIINNIKTRWTKAHTRWSVSVSEPPPEAMISRLCIGGQKNPKRASTIIMVPTNRSFLFPFADNQVPAPNAINKRE